MADVAQFNADQILHQTTSESLRPASEQLESLWINGSQILSLRHKFLVPPSYLNPPPTTLTRVTSWPSSPRSSCASTVACPSSSISVLADRGMCALPLPSWA